MRRTLFLAIGILATAGCSREHGDAPEGTFAPAGPIDNRGNAAAARAAGTERAVGSAEAPAAERPADDAAAFVDAEREEPAQFYDRYDAGGAELTPDRANLEVVTGKVVSRSEEALQIESEQGQPVTLQLEESGQVTLGGSLISQQALRQGAEVRASFRVDGQQRVAEDVTVLETPEAGPGLTLPGLQQPAMQSDRQRPAEIDSGAAGYPEGQMPER